MLYVKPSLRLIACTFAAVLTLPAAATEQYSQNTREEIRLFLREFYITRDEMKIPDTTEFRLPDFAVVRGLDRSLNDHLTSVDPGPIGYYCPSFSTQCFCNDNDATDCIELQLSGKCAGNLEEHGNGWYKCGQAPGASDGCDHWGECP